MKLTRKICGVVAAVILALLTMSLCGCDTEDIYDNDYKIIHEDKTMASVMSENKTTTSYIGKAESFSGVKTALNVVVNDGKIHLSYSVNVESGRFKIVAVDAENLYLIHEGEGNTSDATVEVPNGTYRIRIVGDKAKFSCNIQLLD